jgi:hypothetical protein
MLPFMLINPGYVILRRHSIASGLWRMHALDGTEKQFVDEMIYCYGKPGEMLGQLAWRGLWGEPFERKFPALRLIGEGALFVSTLDAWVLDMARNESVIEEYSILPIPGEEGKASLEKKNRSRYVTFFSKKYPLRIDEILKAFGYLASGPGEIKLTVISDEENENELKKKIIKQKSDDFTDILIPSDPAAVDKELERCQALIFIEDPAMPVEAAPVYKAVMKKCLPVLSDIPQRLNLPDKPFPKISFHDPVNDLISLLESIKDKNLAGLCASGVKSWKKTCRAGASFQMKENESSFSNILLASVERALEVKSDFSYPIDYPSHLTQYKEKLAGHIYDRLEGFDVTDDIKDAVSFIVGKR